MVLPRDEAAEVSEGLSRLCVVGDLGPLHKMLRLQVINEA